MSLVELFDSSVDLSNLYKPSEVIRGENGEAGKHAAFFKELFQGMSKNHSFLQQDGARILNARNKEEPDARGAFKELQYAYACYPDKCVKLARVCTFVERGDIDEILNNKNRTNRLKNLFEKVTAIAPEHQGIAIPFALKLTVLKDAIEFNEFSELYFGNLNQFIRQMSDEDKNNAALDIIIGLKTLHDLGIAHRDLKLENVLVEKSNTRGKAGICDFDFYLGEEEAINQRFLFGTPYWLSPERAAAFLKGAQTKEILFQSDVYALGLILYCLYENKWPEKLARGASLSTPQIISEIAALEGEAIFKEPPITDCLKHLIWEMLSPQVYRPTIGEVAERFLETVHKPSFILCDRSI